MSRRNLKFSRTTRRSNGRAPRIGPPRSAAIRVIQEIPRPLVSTKMTTRWVRYNPTTAGTTSGGAIFVSVTAFGSMAGWFGSSTTSYLYNCDSIQLRKVRIWALCNVATQFGGGQTVSFEFVGPNMHETKRTLALGPNQEPQFTQFRPPLNGAASWPYNLQDYINVDIFRIIWSPNCSFVIDFLVSYVEPESTGVQQSSVTAATPGRSYPYLDTLQTLAVYTTPGLIAIGEGLPISAA